MPIATLETPQSLAPVEVQVVSDPRWVVELLGATELVNGLGDLFASDTAPSNSGTDAVRAGYARLAAEYRQRAPSNVRSGGLPGELDPL